MFNLREGLLEQILPLPPGFSLTAANPVPQLNEDLRFYSTTQISFHPPLNTQLVRTD